MCIREIRAQAHGLTKLRQNIFAVCTLASKQQSEHVVRFGAVRLRSQRSANACNRHIPIGAGTGRSGDIDPGLELRQRFIEIARAKINGSEVDVCGGEGRQERNRALQVSSCVLYLARFAQSGSEKGITSACGRIKSNSLLQLGNAFGFRTAVPQRNAKIVV